MATSTTNLSLIKPAGTDKVRIAQINQNMDILDEKIGPVGNTSVQNQIIANDSGMAIVSTGNTHAAIASGQYVYIRSHSNLAEGLYKANSAISANATLSTSNVTQVSSGGMNDLKGRIDSLNSQIEYVACTTTKGDGVSAISINARKVGRVCIVSGTIDFSSSPSVWTNYDVCTITNGQTSVTSTVYVVALVFSNSGKIATIEINPGENKLIFRPLGNSSYTDTNGRFELIYPTN